MLPSGHPDSTPLWSSRLRSPLSSRAKSRDLAFSRLRRQYPGNDALAVRIYTPMRIMWWTALVILLTGACFAQQAGFRDLTLAWRAPDDHVPSPPPETCPNIKSTISNGIQSTASVVGSKSLELTITKIEPPNFTSGPISLLRYVLRMLPLRQCAFPGSPTAKP